ncbi:winged helix-turn-helix domain-containing protein [Photobacterium sp. MCCC 1A19761]|uniref:winged helix-turn-helix domain-containing protein n=1 Tax=Photobacterium sp. MCCC 1A19761 TaxID=3115000 RepID=UPI00307DAF8C
MWCFDPTARRQLTHSELGITKKLKSTDCKVLELLLIHQGQIVSKEQLVNVAWPGRIVSGSSLTQSIAQLRLALGDNGREQKMIQTVPRQGYRLVTGVIEMVQQPEPESALLQPTQAAAPEHCREHEPSHRHSIPAVASLPASVSRLQWSLLIFLSLLLLITASWLAVITYTNTKTERENWQQVTYERVDYFFEPDDKGEQLFEWLKDVYPDNLRMLYLSKNPEQIYVSCVFQSGSLQEREATNMSFEYGFSSVQIKEAIREQCQ